ncbi:DEAD/DEAH box helicase [Almyronema epifaneia]|uniref:DEAD/DEAH box helicase n=1 Tax=Almyronema epifaneia S1 TaxID=2991925 RepID=A0ABW6IEN8_9CYAN
MNFDDFLSRADDLTLQQLLGKPALDLIVLLDSSLASPKQVRRLLVNLRSRTGLLRDRFSYRLLIDLLKLDEARMLCSFLDIQESNDVYEALKRTRISKGSRREQQLFAFFEMGTPLEGAKAIVSSTEPVCSNYPLFSHQRKASRAVKNHLYREPFKVLLHMPTGAGKTRTAMNIIADHLRIHEPTLVIWLAHSEELCGQAVEEFFCAWNHLGDREITVHRFWGEYNIEPSVAQDGFLVAGLAKVYNRLKTDINFIGKIGRYSSLVVMDEAHQAAAQSYKLILDNLVVPHPKTSLLGLTATPGRSWSDIEQDEELSEIFSRRKVILEVDGYSNPVDYLVEQGYLAKVEYKPLLYEGGVALSKKDIDLIEESFEIPKQILEELANDEKRNLKIILEIERLAIKHRRIIVFSASVQHSDLIASVLNIRGLHANSITKDTEPEERIEIINNFRREDEETRVLCNFGVLTAGFNAPTTSAAVIARPTNSLVLYSQMIGRATRGYRAGGNEYAEVVTVVDSNLPGFSSIADSFVNWEDVWRKYDDEA